MNIFMSNILWRIRAMEGTPSPASDDIATERCRCYGNGQVNSPPPSSAVTWQRFPLWHNTRHRCWLRQQATGNGIKSRRSSIWCQSVISQLRNSMWSGSTECESRSRRVQRVVSGTWRIPIVWLVVTVWIVRSPSPVKSSSYELSCIEWMAVTTG
jgi:hypothetical protein